MPRYHNVVMNLPGKDIGAIVVEHPSPTRLFGNRTGGGETDRAIRVFNNRLYINMRQLVYPAVRKRLPVQNGAAQAEFSDDEIGGQCRVDTPILRRAADRSTETPPECAGGDCRRVCTARESGYRCKRSRAALDAT